MSLRDLWTRLFTRSVTSPKPQTVTRPQPGATTAPNNIRLNLENLEGRELLAANILASFNNGVLSIVGTPGNDTILVHQVGNTIRVNDIDVKNPSDQVVSVPAA